MNDKERAVIEAACAWILSKGSLRELRTRSELVDTVNVYLVSQNPEEKGISYGEIRNRIKEWAQEIDNEIMGIEPSRKPEIEPIDCILMGGHSPEGFRQHITALEDKVNEVIAWINKQ